MMAEERKLGKVRIFSSLLSALCDKYQLILLAVMDIAIAAHLFGASDSSFLIKTVICYFITLFTTFIQYAYLSVRGMGAYEIRAYEKNADTRLMGAFDDVVGAGITISSMTAVCMLVSVLFISYDCIFDLSASAADIVSRLAETAAAALVLIMMTSGRLLRREFYIISFRSFEKNDKDVLKKAFGAVHYPQLMNKLRAVLTVRLTAVIIIAAVMAMCIFCRTGVPFNSVHMAALYAAAAAICGFCYRIEDKRTDEKLPVWTKKHKSLCLMNAIVITAVSFFFAFSFPMQSVYVLFYHDQVYDIEQEIDYDIHALDIPVVEDETAALFTGLMFFIIAALAVVYSSAVTDRKDVENSFSRLGKYASPVLGIFIGGAVLFVWGIYFSFAAMSAVQWIVSVSIGCIVLIANIIAGFIRGKENVR